MHGRGEVVELCVANRIRGSDLQVGPLPVVGGDGQVIVVRRLVVVDCDAHDLDAGWILLSGHGNLIGELVVHFFGPRWRCSP